MFPECPPCVWAKRIQDLSAQTWQQMVWEALQSKRVPATFADCEILNRSLYTTTSHILSRVAVTGIPIHVIQQNLEHPRQRVKAKVGQKGSMMTE